MYKNLILFAILICLVQSNKEQINLQKQLPLNELHAETTDGENLNNLNKRHIVEDKQLDISCKENQIQPQSHITEVETTRIPASPPTRRFQKPNKASSDNNFVREKSDNSNSKKENIDTVTTNMVEDKMSPYDKGIDESFLQANKKGYELEPILFNNKMPFKPMPLKVNTAEDLNLHKCGNIEELADFPATRRILPGILKNPTEKDLIDNRLVQTNPPLIPNDDMKKQVQMNFPNKDAISKSDDVETRNEIDDNELDEDTIMEDSFRSHEINPTRGEGIYNMMNTNVMLLENSRVCYACSSMSDPSCWSPDRRTTVKYCQKGHNSCLTKTFKYKETSFLIRDCGSYCVSPNNEKYSTCSICHSDFCNGASTNSIYKTAVVIIVLFGILFHKF